MLTRAEKIQFLFEISIKIGTSLDLREMLKTCLSTLLRKLNCSAGAVFMKNNNEPIEFGYKQLFSIPRNINGIEAYAVFKKMVHKIDNESSFLEFENNLPLIHEIESETFLHILELPNFGLLTLVKNGEYLEEDIILFLKPITKKIASSCFVCLQNQQIQEDILEKERLQAKLMESMQQLEKSNENIVQIVVAASGIRDPYTAAHQRRVSKIACEIARKMKLSEKQIHGIKLAGLVHDIGKISIPAEILSRSGELIPLEYEYVKHHVKVSYDILKPIDFELPIAEIVYQHHEKIDGSGYPRKLKGDNILIEAKILTVADVVEAIMSHRPYRASLGLKVALDEIRKNRGILYDAAVVDACIEVAKEHDLSFSEIIDFPNSLEK